LLGVDKTPADLDKPATTASQEDKDTYKNAQDLNELAYEDLGLCIDGTTPSGHVAFGCVKGAKTTRLGHGVISLYQRLHLILQNLFQSCDLQTKQDPDEWLTELEDLRERLAATKLDMTDEAFLEHALSNVPQEYNIEVLLLEKRLGHTTSPLTIENLRDALNLKFERMNLKKNKNGRNNNNKESATIAESMGTSQEIVKTRTIRVTSSTAMEKTVTRIIKKGRKCYPTSAITARKCSMRNSTVGRANQD
jgi:hypothetical protein